METPARGPIPVYSPAIQREMETLVYSPVMQREAEALAFKTRRLAALPDAQKAVRHQAGEMTPAAKVSNTLHFQDKRHRTTYDWGTPTSKMSLDDILPMTPSTSDHPEQQRSLSRSLSQISCLSDQPQLFSPRPMAESESLATRRRNGSRTGPRPAGLPPAKPPVWPAWNSQPPSLKLEHNSTDDELMRPITPVLHTSTSAAFITPDKESSDGSRQTLRSVSSTSSLSSSAYRPLSSLRSPRTPQSGGMNRRSRPATVASPPPPYATLTTLWAANSAMNSEQRPASVASPPPFATFENVWQPRPRAPRVSTPAWSTPDGTPPGPFGVFRMRVVL